MLRLVDYEQVPWGTIQGEGIFTGVPSAFVRLHGCDYQCTWCDSKKSWLPGHSYFEKPVADVVGAMRAFRLPHAVITGGNPLLQVDALCELIVGLKQEWVDHEQGDTWRRGMHVTVETQASIWSQDVAMLADFMSLSPKLHDWRDEPLLEYVKYAVTRPEKAAQVKIVVNGAESTWVALDHIERIHALATSLVSRSHRHKLAFVLQPEWSTMRSSVRVVGDTLRAWYAKAPANQELPWVRLLSQAHKGTLLVR